MFFFVYAFQFYVDCIRRTFQLDEMSVVRVDFRSVSTLEWNQMVSILCYNFGVSYFAVCASFSTWLHDFYSHSYVIGENLEMAKSSEKGGSMKFFQ